MSRLYVEDEVTLRPTSGTHGRVYSNLAADRIEAVEYLLEIHQSIARDVDRPVPDGLEVEWEILTLRRFEDNE